MIFGPLLIKFEAHEVEFDVGPAFTDLNPLYRAAAIAYVQPYTLSSQLGRISEERSTELLAAAYAEGVIFDSRPTMTSQEIRSWLIAHPNEFTIIREYAEHRRNFEEGDGNAESPGPETGSSDGAPFGGD